MIQPDLQTVFLFLGSNLGDPMQELARARKCIEETIGKIAQQSNLYKTAAWGKTDQPDFLNQVIVLHTLLTPYAILKETQRIESMLGRVRSTHWGPRIIDIDILFFGDEIISTADLKIPHPGIAERKFTLVPLAEVAPGFVHPVLKKTCSELLDECKDTLSVIQWKP